MYEMILNDEIRRHDVGHIAKYKYQQSYIHIWQVIFFFKPMKV